MRRPAAIALCVIVSIIVFAMLVHPGRESGELEATLHREEHLIGRSLEGSPIIAHQFGDGSDTALLVIASIHGSEPAGTPVSEALMEWVEQNPSALGDQTLLVVPNANPDGIARRARFNQNSVDLNRNFPAENRVASKRFGKSALSEPEARALFDLIGKFQPAAIVSIHQPLACVDYDGPAAELAAAMSAACDLPVKRLGSRPGSLGAYFGETLGRPIITLELPRYSKDPAGAYLGTLTAAVRHLYRTSSN